jgi:two-component system cell cycle response regulator
MADTSHQDMMERKILTVDDDMVTRLIVSTAFRGFACKIIEAGDGVEGLALADVELPDLILLDNEMPVMDGMEMLTRLKANAATRKIPVLMLTGNSRRETVTQIARMGVRDYVVKPFTAEQIVTRVRRIVELKAQSERAGLLVERAKRIVDMDTRRQQSARAKRSDEQLQILVVDDKPAVVELIQKGFAGTAWQVRHVTQPGEALEVCNRQMPDVMLISLSLPGGAGFTLFRMLRASPEAKGLPMFALSVQNAAAEQEQARQLGFSGIVTKPIDLAGLRRKIIHTLDLDTSQQYFQQKTKTLVVTLPVSFNQLVATEIAPHLREKVCEAVDNGLSTLVIDLSQLLAVDANVIKLGQDIVKLSAEFGLRCALIVAEGISGECAKFPETKDWVFARSFDKAIEELDGVGKA